MEACGKRSATLLSLAMDAARRSELQHHHGAVLFSHGGKRVHSFRCNIYPTRRKMTNSLMVRSMHAEAHALLALTTEEKPSDQPYLQKGREENSKERVAEEWAI